MTDSDSLPSLPLFPLGTALFPGGLLPLRIFEVRYLDMVRKCHAAGAPFGVVALQSGSEVRKAGAAPEQLHAVGTLARIADLQTLQPGLLQVQCEGGQRFHIESSRQLPHGLWMAAARLLPPDAPVTVPEHLRSAAQVLAQVLPRAHAAGRALLPTPQQLQDCGWVANRWAELLALPLPLKQQLLALDSPLLRLELIADELERLSLGAARS